MILKSSDDKQIQIQELERLISIAPASVKPKIEKELRTFLAGAKGESEASYLIDFNLSTAKNSCVIHDLRLEYKGRTAQIDHLIIHRTLNFYVIETKHFNNGISINDNGEFMQWNSFKKTFEGVASPFAQNERHISVLNEVVDNLIEMPTRLGIKLLPNFHSKVIVNSQSRIDRPKKFDTSDLIKAEALIDHLKNDLENMGLFNAVAKVVSVETLENIGKQIVRLHRPLKINYAAKFGLDEPTIRPEIIQNPSHTDETKKAGSKQSDDERFACKKCSGTNIKIQYGKFGYYFKCSDCDGNSNIKISCGFDNHNERLRKDGSKFYRECVECKTSILFFEN